MRPEKQHKELILINALKRMRRIAVYAEFGFKARRHDVLANYSFEGQQFFKAMDLALKQRKLTIGEVPGPTESIPPAVAEVFKVAALNFISEPAQKSVIERIELAAISERIHGENVQGESISPFGKKPQENIAQLAWGAFSLKK